MIQDCGATAIKGPIIYRPATKMSGFLGLCWTWLLVKIHFKRNLKSSLNLLVTISFDDVVSLAYPLPFFFSFFFSFFFKGPGRVGPFIQEKWKVRKMQPFIFTWKLLEVLLLIFFSFPKKNTNKESIDRKEHEKSSNQMKTISSEKNTKRVRMEWKRFSPHRTRKLSERKRFSPKRSREEL